MKRESNLSLCVKASPSSCCDLNLTLREGTKPIFGVSRAISVDSVFLWFRWT